MTSALVIVCSVGSIVVKEPELAIAIGSKSIGKVVAHQGIRLVVPGRIRIARVWR